MRTALDGVDVVHIRVDILTVVGVVHHSHLDRYALLLSLQIDDIVEEMCTVAVNVANELLESVLGVEHLLLCISFFVGTHVSKRDGDAGIQISQLSHSLCNDVILIGCSGEYSGVGPELLACTSEFSLTNNLYRVKRLTLFILLLIDLAVAEHLRQHMCGESVHTADAHTVETAADLV